MKNKIDFTPAQIWVAPHGYQNILEEEILRLEKIPSQHKQDFARIWIEDWCLLKHKNNYKPLWAQSCWSDLEKISFKSIKDAAKILLARKKFWWPQSFQYHRRTHLIEEQLPRLPRRRIKCEFQKPLNPTQDYGVFFLMSEKEMIIANQISSYDPLGEAPFLEDKVNPPSRAYLKLWELFTFYNIHPPKPKEVCVELGASPGGWTWVLHQLGCEVFSFDRAPLNGTLRNQINIHHQIKDAFSVTPQMLNAKVDWLFSDLICEPQKLLNYLESTWNILENKNTNFVCTLKFKGQTDFALIEKFRKWPNVQLLHLANNKHELTFIKLKSGSL